MVVVGEGEGMGIRDERRELKRDIDDKRERGNRGDEAGSRYTEWGEGGGERQKWKGGWGIGVVVWGRGDMVRVCAREKKSEERRVNK